MEATVAVNFILSYLYNKLPRRRVDMFGEILEQLLQNNLEGFWSSQFSKSKHLFIAAPVSFRYIFHSGIGVNPVDPLINQVAASCLIDVYEILSYFPENLTLFLEPGKVQYSLNPSESNIDIWKSDQRNYELFELLKQGLVQPPGLESHSQESETIEKLPICTTGVISYSTSFAWQKPGHQVVQPISEGCFIQKSSSTPNFTAASFAQTKFGSTKLKCQLKRSSRISTYLAQQRSIVAAISTLSVQESTVTASISMGSGSPSSLSPYFESPTTMPTQRSISLSPCVRPQRGHSPPFFNMPLILPPFTSSSESMGMFPSIMTSTTPTVPVIQITRVDITPVTLVVTNVDDPYPWCRQSEN